MSFKLQQQQTKQKKMNKCAEKLQVLKKVVSTRRAYAYKTYFSHVSLSTLGYKANTGTNIVQLSAPPEMFYYFSVSFSVCTV